MTTTDVIHDGFLASLGASLNDPSAKEKLDLKEVTSRLTELIENGHEETAAKAVQLLGTAAGSHEEWRPVFQSSGVLAYAAQRVGVSTTPTSLAKQYLRVVGNCVVDNDENRKLVTVYLPDLISCLERKELLATTVLVIMNLCNDYDLAQEEAAELRLDSTITELLASNAIPEEAISYAIELLQWTTEKLTKSQIEEDKSVPIFTNLLGVALRYDEDNYHDYIALITHYLQSPEFQSKVATPEIVSRLVDLTFDYESRLTEGEAQDVFRALATQQDPKKTPSEDLIVLLMVHLINSLSAISATDTFVHSFTIQNSPYTKLRSTLQYRNPTPSAVCACVVLGNLVTSDQISRSIIEDFGIHLPLISILATSKEPALLYAAAGFARNLAIPQQNKVLLAEENVIEVCCHLLVNADPSVRGEGAALLGKLVTNNLANIKKVIYEGIPDEVPIVQIQGTELPDRPTILYHIVTQALAPSSPLPSTSMKNPMVELGRIIIAMFRHLGQADVGPETKVVAQDMFKVPLIARPLARLVRQRFYTDARSEGLLGLGLMAQSPEGAICVIKEFSEDSGLLGAIKEFAFSQRQEGQVGGMGLGRDYQNALVLLNGLVNNGLGIMDMGLKDEIDMTQEELGRLTL